MVSLMTFKPQPAQHPETQQERARVPRVREDVFHSCKSKLAPWSVVKLNLTSILPCFVTVHLTCRERASRLLARSLQHCKN